MGLLATAAAGALGYLIGTFPSADLAARAATGGEVDLRDHGSGNPGGTNAAQVLGKGWGVAVIAADAVKGVGAGFLGRAIAGDTGTYVAATAAVAGHIYPVWSRFRGGKGIATAGGTTIAVFPAYVPFDAAVIGGTALVTKRSDLATYAAGAAWVGASAVWAWRDWPNLWGPEPGPGLVAWSAAVSGLVIAKFVAAKRQAAATAPAVTDASARPAA